MVSLVFRLDRVLQSKFSLRKISRANQPPLTTQKTVVDCSERSILTGMLLMTTLSLSRLLLTYPIISPEAIVVFRPLFVWLLKVTLRLLLILMMVVLPLHQLIQPVKSPPVLRPPLFVPPATLMM